MTIQEMVKRKEELGYTCTKIADLSGVPLETVQEVLNGAKEGVSYEILHALELVLSHPRNMQISEVQPVYMTRQQADYTLEDYYQIPDDIRIELIDGVIYTMDAPGTLHQLIGGFIYAKLLNHVMTHGGLCMPMISPVDVQLDCDDKTMVQPDVIIICDKDKIINRCVYGAPDFVIEVLSKSTKKKDSVIKLEKYMNAGVREYWMIDPMRKNVVVYDFEHDDYSVLYGFDAKVPVRIWEGECAIDFTEVYEYIRFLYERE